MEEVDLKLRREKLSPEGRYCWPAPFTAVCVHFSLAVILQKDQARAHERVGMCDFPWQDLSHSLELSWGTCLCEKCSDVESELYLINRLTPNCATTRQLVPENHQFICRSGSWPVTNLLCESGKGFLHTAAWTSVKPPEQQTLLRAKPGWDPAAKAVEGKYLCLCC